MIVRGVSGYLKLGGQVVMWQLPQGVHFIYQLLLFSFHLFSLTLFLLPCFIVGEEVADYDTLQETLTLLLYV